MITFIRPFSTAKSCVFIFSLLVLVTSIAGAEDESFSVGNVGLSYMIVILLVLNSALFSGLTLGLLSLDKLALEVYMEGEDQRIAKYAKAIYPVREDGNFLLCTLLLGTVATNSLLSIILADIASGLYGFISSTVIIVIFGEIIPQSVLSRPEYGLRVGYFTLPILKAYMIMFYVFAKPASMILNYTLGEEMGTIHTRSGLRKMLEIHVKQGALDIESGNLVDGALKYKDMTVKEVMTPMADVYMLNMTERLNFVTLSDIFTHGFSRIPVYDGEKNNIVGLLLAKDLLFVDPEDEITVSNFINLFGRPLHLVWPDMKLGEVLTAFKRGRSHMAVVRDVNNAGDTDPFYEIKGIITLEDIIEEILGEEISDETDVDNQDTEIVGMGLGEVLMVPNAEGRNLTSINRDTARIRLLNPEALEEQLSNNEVHALAAHLRSNVPQLRVLLTGDANKEPLLTDVEALVKKSSVLSLRKTGASTAANEDALYRRGKPSQACTLIISGKLEVFAGKEGFRSELGPFSLIGADALLSDEGYVPDFTASVFSDKLRCLQVTRSICMSVAPISVGALTSGSSLETSSQRLQRKQSQRKANMSRSVGFDATSGSAPRSVSPTSPKASSHSSAGTAVGYNRGEWTPLVSSSDSKEDNKTSDNSDIESGNAVNPLHMSYEALNQSNKSPDR